MGDRCPIDVLPQGPTARSCEPPFRIDRDARIRRRSTTSAPSAIACPDTLCPRRGRPPADRLASGTDGRHHVVGRRRLDDDRRAAIDHAVERTPRLVVPVVAGMQDPGARPELEERSETM